MDHKNIKFIQGALWCFAMIIVIITCIVFKSLSNKVNEDCIEQYSEVETPEEIIYDGSEKNPYIEGVQ